MKDLLKASIPIIIETFIGFGIFKLLDTFISFIYKHFGETGLYVSTFTIIIIVGTIINYVVYKYVSDNKESEE